MMATFDSRHPTARRHPAADIRHPVVGCRPSNVECSPSSHIPAVGRRPSRVAALLLAFAAFSVRAEEVSTNCVETAVSGGPAATAYATAAENAYTNHAGNVISGVVVALDARTATISNAEETVALPLSIFPDAERRRIAAEFVLSRGGGQTDLLRVPTDVKRTVDGLKKAIVRSRKRAALGLCPREESDDFCEKTASAIRAYLDKQVESGAITPAERQSLGR